MELHYYPETLRFFDDLRSRSMNKTIRIIIAFCLSSLFSAPALSQQHLIFLDGYLGWYYSLPAYLKDNHAQLETLPFSGFSVVGNVFTSYVMSADPNSNNVTYERVWNEVGILENVFQVKTDNFLRINLDFPGDFWDDDVWQITARNFSAVAKAAKNLGFKGVLFDDEPYASGQHLHANYMSNFKFPKKAAVQANPGNYEQWEIDESETNRGDWIDYSCRINGINEVDSENCAYRNLNYSFIEHMDKLTSRFKDIMLAMQVEFPDITLLVLHGAATAHPGTNTPGHYIKPNSLFETNEYKGAMFAGFQKGLAGNAQLHDLGEFYSYSADAHFQNAYQWRKHEIASEASNALDASYQWVIPGGQRSTWSDDVGVGFMVSDYDQAYFDRGGYNTSGLCTPADVESRFMKAFDASDDYVMFYSDSSLSSCESDIRWMDVSSPVEPQWLNMMQRVYNSIQALPDPQETQFFVIPVDNQKHVVIPL